MANSMANVGPGIITRIVPIATAQMREIIFTLPVVIGNHFGTKLPEIFFRCFEWRNRYQPRCKIDCKYEIDNKSEKGNQVRLVVYYVSGKQDVHILRKQSSAKKDHTAAVDVRDD